MKFVLNIQKKHLTIFMVFVCLPISGLTISRIGAPGALAKDVIDGGKAMTNGIQYEEVQINNATGVRILKDSAFEKDYYLTDMANEGYPVKVFAFSSSGSIDVFFKMIETFEFTR